ncbi:MAG: acyl-CoA dehydrogenase family protein [bacterium]
MAGTDQPARFLTLLARSPRWTRLCDLRPGLDFGLAESVLDAAGKLADSVLAPLDLQADRQGCRLEHGRVQVPEGYAAAYATLAKGGWIGLDLPETLGGSGLPKTFAALTGALFDEACPAFMMAPGASRAAGHLLARHAPDLAADWVPALIAGDRTATICLSEPGAGSDVGRIRTRADVLDGIWRITGEKCWISFGDHRLTPVIGHLILARSNMAAGTGGLSLYLCPSVWDGKPNGIHLLGIEEKLGLHGSPTCALRFEDARAWAIGAEGQGLRTLFDMIELMRLQTGGQGLGLASRACRIAETYAQTRLQGGAPTVPPVPIATHPDVVRQLRLMRDRTELLRAAVVELGLMLDLGDTALAALLLPLIKNFGAETGFKVSSSGIQVLGGAGYTRDWPLERGLRDARILSIYEGTTGMQGLDFLERRLIRDSSGFAEFLGELTPVAPAIAARLRTIAATLTDCPDPMRRAAAADAWLRAGYLGVTAWLAPRLDRDVTVALPERLEVLAAEIAAALGSGQNTEA